MVIQLSSPFEDTIFVYPSLNGWTALNSIWCFQRTVLEWLEGVME